MSIQKDSANAAADKDINIMRLQSEVKQSQERLDEMQREVPNVYFLQLKSILNQDYTFMCV